MKKKIVLVGNTAWSMNNFRRGLIKELTRNNFEVFVLAPYDESVNELKQICNYESIKIERKKTNPLLDLKLLYDLYAKYKKINPDLIIHYTIKPIIYGSIAAKLSRNRTIAITTGLGYAFLENNLISKIARNLYSFSLKFSEEVWFLNEDDKSVFLKYNIISKEKTFILNSEGVNTQKFKPINNINNKKINFLLIARMIWDKGIKEFVEAAKIIKDKYPDIKFKLLGPIDEGNPNSIDLKTIKNWQKEKLIEYLGVTDDVTKFISKSDCVVLPSFYREGVPRTLLEAASMETPIITTDNVGCRNVVDHKINGYLCKKKSSTDLAEKMMDFIELSNKDKKKMGKKGREKILKEFDEKIIVKKYLEKINYLLKQE